MIIFLYGEDAYRSRQKLKEMIEHFKNPAFSGNLGSCEIKKSQRGGLNLKYFDGKDLRFEDFEEEIQQTSIFQGKKILILRDILFNREFKEKFLNNYKDFVDNKNIILFYEGGKISQNDSFFIFLKKYAKTQEFKLLDRRKLRDWVKKEFKSYQTTITPEALEELVNFVGNNLWQMSNEIKKLASFKPKQPVGAEEVKTLVTSVIETDIFKTIDAIALKNKRQALELLHRHLEKGDSPSYLLSMITFQFRNIIEIKDMVEKNKSYSTILRQSKLHPFVVKKSYNLAKRFTVEKLKKIYQKIFQVDCDIKTGKTEPEAALDLLVAGI